MPSMQPGLGVILSASGDIENEIVRQCAATGHDIRVSKRCADDVELIAAMRAGLGRVALIDDLNVEHAEPIVEAARESEVQLVVLENSFGTSHAWDQLGGFPTVRATDSVARILDVVRAAAGAAIGTTAGETSDAGVPETVGDAHTTTVAEPAEHAKPLPLAEETTTAGPYTDHTAPEHNGGVREGKGLETSADEDATRVFETAPEGHERDQIVHAGAHGSQTGTGAQAGTQGSAQAGTQTGPQSSTQSSAQSSEILRAPDATSGLNDAAPKTPIAPDQTANYWDSLQLASHNPVQNHNPLHNPEHNPVQTADHFADFMASTPNSPPPPPGLTTTNASHEPPRIATENSTHRTEDSETRERTSSWFMSLLRTSKRNESQERQHTTPMANQPPATTPAAHETSDHVSADAPKPEPARATSLEPDRAPDPATAQTIAGRQAKIIAVWGPIGSPGRSTAVLNIAAELSTDASVIVIDGDTYGPSLAQLLGASGDQPGIAVAARAASHGTLDDDTLNRLVIHAMPGMRVISGLPRPERWIDVRRLGYEALLKSLAEKCDYLVIDCGFGIDGDSGDVMTPHRNVIARVSLEKCDALVAVTSDEPIVLTRFIRDIETIATSWPHLEPCVLVNRKLRTPQRSDRDDMSDLRELLAPWSREPAIVPHASEALSRAAALGLTLRELDHKLPARAAYRKLTTHLIKTFATASPATRQKISATA